MLNLFDEDFDAMELVEGALALNKAINPETKVEWALAELEALLHQAKVMLPLDLEPKQRFAALLDLFYRQWGFVVIMRLILTHEMALWIRC